MRKKPFAVLLICVLLVLILFLINAKIGFLPVTWTDFSAYFSLGKTTPAMRIFLNIRLPRIIVMTLTGMGLALSGCLIQDISKNELADPGLLGINAGAGIMIIWFSILRTGIQLNSIFYLPLLAFIGGLAVSILIYSLSSSKWRGISALRLVLNGVAIQAGLNALMTLCVYKMDDKQIDTLSRWQAGTILYANWKYVSILLPWILLGFILAFFHSRQLDILSMGDETASGVGVAVKKEKAWLLFLAAGLASAAVALGGNLSFVGLIAPHIARRIAGRKHHWLLPTCCLLGGIFVLIADGISRSLTIFGDMPTGIITSIIGVPYFVFILIIQSRRKRYG